MMLDKKDFKPLIKKVVQESIVKFVKAKIGKENNFQILDLLIPKERNIRSIVGGLETSMGKTLWEPLAKAIAQKSGFLVIPNNLLKPDPFPSHLSSLLQTIIEDREGNYGQYDGNSTEVEIIRACSRFKTSPIQNFIRPPRGHGVDIWLSKDGVDYFFDTKTVQPNVGDYKKFLAQVINWKAFYYSKFPTGKCVACIVFPYSPYKKSKFWDKTKGGGKPLDPSTDALVEDEFWDTISGTKRTFELIVEAFIEMARDRILEKEFDRLFDRETQNKILNKAKGDIF